LQLFYLSLGFFIFIERIIMRTVLNNTREVFHYFANKVQSEGRCGNVSFNGRLAYSYRAVIGKHFPDGIALSDSKYSVTTSSHQSDLRYACQHLRRVYVPEPDSDYGSYKAVKREVESLLRKASTAKSKRECYLGEALDKVENFNTFAKWCNSELRIEQPVTDPESLKAIAKGVKEELNRVNAQRKERERLQALDNAAKLVEWRNGSNVYLSYSQSIALRINGDLIETTKGASIQLSEAPTLWKLINRVMRGDRDYEVGQPVGVYRLTKIRRDGSIVVGCHDIPHSELSLMAQSLNLE